MPHITVGGNAFYYESDSYCPPWEHEPPTVLISHGIGRNLNFFRPWVPHLADRFRVIRRDMRGHGKSFDPGSDYAWSLNDLIDDILGFLDEMNIKRVHYVGESAGGVLGLALAAKFPDRLLSVTAISAPGAIPAKALDAMVKSTGATSMRDAIFTLDTADWVDAQADGGGLTLLNRNHRDWVVDQWRTIEQYNLAGIIDLLPTLDWRSLLPEITVPTLLLCPSRSPLTSVEDQRNMAASIKNARLVIVNGRAHEIYVDMADQCISAWKDFIANSVL